ncbi:hypothetical protein, conserved, partial [Eimeria maxima]
MLLNENLVQTDKVAASSVFWAQKVKLLAARASLKAIAIPEVSVGQPNTKLLWCSASKTAFYKQEQEAEKRAETVNTLELRLRLLQEEVRAVSTCDPERLQQLREEISFARAALERWTDNIFIIREGLAARDIGCFLCFAPSPYRV